MANKIKVDLEFNANTERAKRQMADLQGQLNNIMSTTSRSSRIDAFTKDINNASVAATKLSANLSQAFNKETGKLDLTKFNYELKQSGMTLEQYKAALMSAGPAGRQAFQQLAKAITVAETPMLRLSGVMKKFGATLMNTVRWQLSSSLIQGFTSALSTAYNYAQDLNKSLTDIRVVTGYSAEAMEKFADKANKAAKNLRTTTNEYAKASLIYFQQGLSMEEVEKRTATTVKMAQVTGDSMEEVSNQLTSIWNNFYDGSKTLEYYADVITALGAATASSSEEIAQGLEKFAAVAETVGLSYEYATAALATVTAETRQSADIVGTAFKTLFSRLQDLELGKTLEDNVTLGQYSKALEAVGVNILKSNGDLKDMDQILNELGAKWNNISKAQQVSLAQNVAGVRQYTQLIALMDNWDTFQINLETATDAEGTLEDQQKIWAESWEGASNRVRASLETIYESLLDDDFFIDFLNFTSDLTDAIGAMVKGLGGLQTILPAIGGLLLNTFSGKIAENIDRTVHSIRSITPSGRKKTEELKASASQGLYTDVPKRGIDAFTAEASNDQAKMQTIFNEKSRNLNQTQKIAAETQLQYNLAKTDAVKLAAQEAEQAKKTLNLKKTETVLQANLTQEQRKKLNIELERQQQAAFSERIAQDVNPLGSQRMDEAFGEEGTSQQRLAALDEISSRLQGLGIESEQVSSKMQNLMGEEFAQKFKDYAASVEQARQATQNFDQENTPENELAMNTAIQNLKSSHESLFQSIRKTADSTADLGVLDEKQRALIEELYQASRNYGISMGEVATKTSEANEATKKFNRNLEQSIQGRKSVTQDFVSLTGAVSTLSFGLQSLSSAFNALSNPDLTWGEKLLSVITSLSMGLGMMISGIKSLQSVNLKNVGTTLLNILTFGKYNKVLQEKIELEKKANSQKKTDTETSKIKQQTSAQNEQNLAIQKRNNLQNKTLTNTAKDKQEIATTKQKTNAINQQTGAIKAKRIEEKIDKADGSGDSVLGLAATETQTAAYLKETAVIKQKRLAEKADRADGNGDSNPLALASTEQMAMAIKTLTVEISRKIMKENEDRLNGGPVTPLDEAQLRSQINAIRQYIIELERKNLKEGKTGKFASLPIQQQDQLISDAFISPTMSNGGEFDWNPDVFNSPITNPTNAPQLPGKVSPKGFLGKGGLLGKGEALGKLFGAGGAGGAGASGVLTAGMLAPMAGILGAVAVIATIAISIKKGLESVENQAKAAEEHAKMLDESFEATKQKFDELMSSSEAHDEALKSMKELQKGTVEYTQALNDANAKALELINNYKDLEYHWQDGAIVFENMEEVLEEESRKVNYSMSRSQLAKVDAIEKRTRADVVNFARNELGDVRAGYDSNFLGIGLGDPEESNTEKALYSLAEQYQEHGEKIFDDFSALITDTALELNDHSIVAALINNSEKVEELTRTIAREETREQEAWKNAFIMENNLGDNKNAEAIASQAYKEIDSEAKTQAKKNVDDLIGGGWVNNADAVAAYAKMVLGVDEDATIKKVGSGGGSGYEIGDYRIHDLGGAGFTIKKRDSEGNWNVQGEENEYAWSDAKQQLIDAEENRILSGNIDEYEKEANRVRLQLNAAGIKVTDKMSDQKMTEAVNEYFNSGEFKLTQFSGEEIKKIKPENIQDPEMKAALTKALGNYWDALREANKNNTTKFGEKLVENAESDLQTVIQDAGMTEESFDNYIKQFSDYGDAAEEVGKEIIKTTNAQDKLNEIFSDSSGAIASGIKALAEGKNVSGDFANAVTKIQSQLTSWLNVDLGYDYVAKNIGLIQQAANGSAEALRQLRTEAALAAVENLSTEFDSAKNFLNDFIEVSRTKDYQIGQVFGNGEGESDVLAGFQTLLEEGQLDADTLQSILANAGFQIDIQLNPVTGEKELNQLVYVGTDFVNDMQGAEGEAERYHYIKETLEDLEAEYNAINKARERAWGATRTLYIEDEINKTKELLATQRAYINEINKNLPKDREVLSTYGAKFDEYGRVQNADELLEQYKNDEGFKTAFDQYEETLNLLESERYKLQDLLNQEIDLKLEKIQAEIELKISLNNDSKKTLDYFIENLNDTMADAADKIAKTMQKNMFDLDSLNTEKQGVIDSFTAQGLSSEQVEKLFSGDFDETAFTDVNGNIIQLTKSSIDGLREYRDNLIETMSAWQESYEALSDSIIEAIESENQKMQEKIDLIGNYIEVLNKFKDITDLLGENILRSDVFANATKKLLETSFESSQDALVSAKAKYEANKDELKQINDALDAAKKSGDEAAIKEWTEAKEKQEAIVAESEKDWLTHLENSLKAAAEIYKNELNSALEDFKKGMMGGLTEDAFYEKYELRQKANERYLEDYQKIYELSKLNRDVVNSMDDTDSIKAKQTLKKLQQEINELNESNAEVTQYQVDELRAKYELRLAEIALEEAQNAKSQVRMSRDNEGNWSYVYTADESKIDEARQKYEDSLYKYQTLSQERIQEIQDQMLNLPKEYAEALEKIYADTTMSEEERSERIANITLFYESQYGYLADQLEIALKDAEEVYNDDWKAYSEATGYKYSAADEWIDKFEDTTYKELTGYNSLAAAQGAFVNKNTAMKTALNTAMEEYRKKTKNSLKKAGISWEEYLTLINEKTSAASTATGTLAGDVSKLAEATKTAFSTMVTNVQGFQESYKTALAPFIKENEKLLGTIDKILEAYSKLDARSKTTPPTTYYGTKSPLYDENGTADVYQDATTASDITHMLDLGSDKVSNITSTKARNGMYLTTWDEEDEEGNKQSYEGYTQFDATNGNYYWNTSQDVIASSTTKEESDEEGAYSGYNNRDYEEAELIKWKSYMRANGEAITETIYGADEKPKYYIMSGKSSNKLIPVKIIDDLKAANKGFYDGHGRTLYDPNDFLPEVPDKIEINLDKKQSFTRYNKPSAEATHTTRKPYDHEDSQLINNIKNGYVQLTDIAGMWNWVTLNQLKSLKAFDTGGYTGSWDSSGRIAMLHQKELVLNAADTENFLAAVNIIRDIASAIDLRAIAQQSALSMLSYLPTPQNQSTLQQEVTITAEFPNVKDRNEIEEAFKSLVNHASQFANRTK